MSVLTNSRLTIIRTEFLNDIVRMLWPRINVAGSQIVMDTVNPMFKTMLPSMLQSLHFTKVNLGDVPLKISRVLATKTATDGIKLDMNVDWDGACDIELDGTGIPALGVKSVKLNGRLSVLLCPLTNVIPLIGAAQIAFVNPPILKLDFTGAANVADFSAIDGSVRKVILSIINSMLTLPNRLLIKLDTNNDYFATFLEPVGVIRITVDKAYGFAEEAKGKVKHLFSKVTRAAPDCYTKVEVGAEPEWKTSTKSNTTNPTWGETKDFVVSDFDQVIKLDVEDADVGGDDEVGLGVTTVEEILRAGGSKELALVRKGEETEGRVGMSAQFFKFEADASSFSSTSAGQICGLATILVAGAFDIKGDRKALHPSVKVTFGEKHKFQTGVMSDAPGTDISNPSFDSNFRVPLTSDIMGGSFRIALFDGEKEVGGVDVPFADVQKAEGMQVAQKFDMGGGTSVRAAIRLKGLRPAAIEEMKLPERPRGGPQGQAGAGAQA